MTTGDIPVWVGLVLTIVSMIATGAAIYGAIRSDIRHMHERVARLEKFQDSIGPMRNWWRESKAGDLR